MSWEGASRASTRRRGWWRRTEGKRWPRAPFFGAEACRCTRPPYLVQGLAEVVHPDVFRQQPRQTVRPQALEGVRREMLRDVGDRNPELYPQPRACLKAVHKPWQVDVYADDIGPEGRGLGQGFPARGYNGQHGVAHLGDALLELRRRQAVMVHD